MPLDLNLLPGRFAVCRLEPRDAVPAWVPSAGALVVRGPLPFDAVGIMAGLSGALAAANIALFAVSTFDTDYILIREERIGEARAALSARGYVVLG